MDPRNSVLNLDLGSDSFLASMGFEPFAGSSNLGAAQSTPNSGQAVLFDSSMGYEAYGGPSTQAYAGGSTQAPTSQVPIELDERPTKTAARATRAKKTKRPAVRVKGSNFSAAEDLLIVKGWLEISKDAVINTNQKGSTFWDRILEHYNGRRGDLPPRTYRSLQSRWDLIKEVVGKFIGYITQVEQANPSGYTDANKISMAMAVYNSLEKVPFQLMHCYEIMKDEPKWMDNRHNKGPPQADVDVYSQFTPNEEHTVENSGDDSSPTPSPVRRKRPMGREASKNRRKKSTSSSSAASEFVGQLQVLNLDKERYWKEEAERRTAQHQDVIMLEREKIAL